MSRYDAVLFDMDGTLLNTLDDIQDALNRTLLEFDYPTHGSEAVKGFLGSGAYQLVQRALPAHADDGEIRRVLAAYKLRYERHINVRTHPYQGVLPMLTALDEAGLKLAIISNKGDENVKRLTREHFGSLIPVAIGASDALPLKPAPDMLQAAMQKLGTEPERTLYIGDAPTDYEAACNADMDSILALWGYGDPRELLLLPPLFFAGDPAELPMLILQEQEGFS